MNVIGGGGFKNKPRALMCYICGKEYGTASLNIHIKTCIKKWETEEMKKPLKQRRPLPQPPKEFDMIIGKLQDGNANMEDLDMYNVQANDKWNDEALIRCDYCNRTFLPERMPGHKKICSKEKPFKPLGGNNEDKGKQSEKFDNYDDEKPIVKNSISTTTKKVVSSDAYETYKSPDISKGNKKIPSESSSKASVSTSQTFKKPKAIMCYICGREFGTASVGIHIKSCIKKWEDEQAKKPYSQRRPCPNPPSGWEDLVERLAAGENVNFDELDSLNVQANDKWNEEALIRCSNCNRTFLPDRMPAHAKVCSKDAPFKPLPSSNKGMTSTVNNPKLVKGSSKEYYDDDDEPNVKTTYGKSTNTTSSIKSSGVSQSTTLKSGGLKAGGMNRLQEMQMQSMQLVPCDICGRKFNSERIDVHVNACKRAKKGEAKHAKKVAAAEKKQKELEKFKEKESKYKTQKWRQQHQQFQEALQYMKKVETVEKRGGTYEEIRSIQQPSMNAYSDLKACPCCGRKFDSKRIDKHIDICQNVVNKPKAPPTKSSYTSGPSSGSYGNYSNSSSTTNYSNSSKPKEIASNQYIPPSTAKGTTKGGGFQTATPKTTQLTSQYNKPSSNNNIFSSEYGNNKPFPVQKTSTTNMKNEPLSVQGSSSKVTGIKKTSYY